MPPPPCSRPCPRALPGARPGPPRREGALPPARHPDARVRDARARRGCRRSSRPGGSGTTARGSGGSRPSSRSGPTSWPRSSSPSIGSCRSSRVRGRDGEMRFWPLAENVHREGILRVTRAPAPNAPQAEAEALARALLDDLGYVGVLALELFEVGGTAARERVRAARPQHGPLDDRRGRHEPVREPSARDPRAPARIDRGGLTRRDGQPDRRRAAARAPVETARRSRAPLREGAAPGRKVGHVTLVGAGEAAVRRRSSWPKPRPRVGARRQPWLPQVRPAIVLPHDGHRRRRVFVSSIRFLPPAKIIVQPTARPPQRRR